MAVPIKAAGVKTSGISSSFIDENRRRIGDLIS
jgi:hypothetical protein